MKSICMDFDGVIHSYHSGWEGPEIISDLPVVGAFATLDSYLTAGLEVFIYSARSETPEGIQAMKEWFRFHNFMNLDQLKFTNKKPHAVLYVDDRAYRFKGTEFPSVEYIQNFKPWHAR